MSETMVSVYYVGRKATKTDNVLNNPHRVWNGFGTSVDVPEAQAQTYFHYPKVWVDKATFRKLNEQRQLDEQEQRKAAQAAASAAGADANDGGDSDGDGDTDGGSAADDGENGGGTMHTGDPGSDERITAIKAAMLSLKPATKDFTQEGSPRIDSVVKALGSNVSSEEYDTALQGLRADGKMPSKADAAYKPAPPPAKAKAKAKASADAS